MKQTDISNDGRIKCDIAIVGYAVNSTSGGFTNKCVKYVDTVGIKYLYSHFYGTYCAEPVAFLQLASQLRKENLSVHILDGLLLGYSREEMVEQLNRIDTDIYAFSLYESSKDDVLFLMNYVKSVHPDAVIITGGPYVTLCYQELLETQPVIDFITVGDSDFALPALVKSLNNRIPVKNIPNVAMRNAKGQVIMSAPCEAIDLNKLEPPARDFTDIIQNKNFSLSICSSRGCGHGVCSFCYLMQYQKNGNQPRFRYRDPKLIVEEIEELIRKYHIKKLTFVDDDFFGPDDIGIRRAMEFFDLLIEKDIHLTLYMNARVASVLYMARNHLLEKAARAGARYFFIGFESYNNDILKRYHKGITIAEIDEILNELEKYGILTNPGLITFDRTIRPEQVKNNIDLLRRLKYYDLFMFTRTLMDLPSDRQKMKDNRVFQTDFTDPCTGKLYNILVQFRDYLYPFYGRVDRNLITDEIRDEVVDEHFAFFYELYEQIKEDEQTIQKIFDCHANNIINILKQAELPQ